MAPRLGYRPELNGLRALAVAAVVLAHLELPTGSGGMAGVDVFFVLSGFLITTLLLEERATTAATDLKAFYMRRAARLFPALALLLAGAVVLALTAATRTDRHAILGGLPFIVGYAGNWAIVGGHGLGPLGHTWSLAVEEQFYLLWPLMLIAALRTRRPRATALVVIGLIVAVAIVVRAAVCGGGSCVYRVYHGTDTRADQLLIGCGLAFAFASGRLAALHGRGGRLAGALALGALVIVALSPLSWDNGVYDTIGMTLTALCSAIVIASLLANDAWVVRRALAWRPLTRIGEVSYGIYLWQGLILGLLYGAGSSRTLRIAVGVPLTLAAAALSYALLEQPLLRRARAARALRAQPPVTTAGR